MSDTLPAYSYAQAGVSIDAGNALVRAIAPLAKATRRTGTEAGLGGFGALFDLKAAGFTDPILVACNDGVGTKVKLAIDHDLHDGIGIDLVAMCVNDLIVQGAEPLFFLDYFASAQLDLAVAQRVIASIAAGCLQAGCALIGGETAEMPGLYAPGDYDLAGFAVGAAERGSLVDGTKVISGDVILGLASSGLHSNGFSLVRRLMADGRLVRSVEELLTPTHIYVASLLPLLKAGKLKALAHITGGGLIENVPRVLPEGLIAGIRADQWSLPPLFDAVRQAGNLAVHELIRTFNCGIGMVLVVAAADVAEVTTRLTNSGETIFQIGTIAAHDGPPACSVEGPAGCWGYADAWVARHPHA